MRVGDRERRLNGEDAALKLRYGELEPRAIVRVSWGELTKKIVVGLSGGAESFSRIFPPKQFGR